MATRIATTQPALAITKIIASTHTPDKRCHARCFLAPIRQTGLGPL